MAKIIIEEFTYSFWVDGRIVEQNTFCSDDDAIRHAKYMGDKVKVARWLEMDGSRLTPRAADGLTTAQKNEVRQMIQSALDTGSA